MAKVSLIGAALALAGCTALERADIANDLSPGATELAPAIADATLKAAGKAASLPELIAYLFGLVAVVGGGYVTRKWIQGKYNAPKETPKA